MSHSEAGTFPLMEYVKALEGKGNRTRGEHVLAALRELGLEPAVQEWRWPKVRNIIVEFSPGAAKRLLFSAHYDAAKGSPGANDNASGVAVLLGLCRQMRQSRLPLTVVFFDREEAWFRTPLFSLGLLGSFCYVWRNNLQNVAAVYNLEFCGLGDLLAAWPISPKETSLVAVKEVQQAAERIALPFKAAPMPRLLFTSDHASFRLRGIANALTLSLVPASQVPTLAALVQGLEGTKLLARRPALPEPLSLIHSARDTSSRLSESSLKLMLSLLLELPQGYRP